MGRLRRLLDNPLLRFKLLVGATLVILAFGNAVALTEIRAETRRVCVERNQRATATAPALQQLVTAHRADHDRHAAAVWQSYLDAAKRAPIPKC